MMALLVFAAALIAFVLDYADAQHKLAVERRDGHACGSWSVLMYLVGIGATWAAIDVSPAILIPTAQGLYLGSLVAMHRARKRCPVKGKVASH